MGSVIPCGCHGQGERIHEKGSLGCQYRIAKAAIAPVVGLYAPVMQSGKTYTASYLTENFAYRLVKFAGPLKEMLKPLLYELGLDAGSCVDGYLKENTFPELGGKSPRYALQTLGTEWARETIDPDLWVRIAMRKVASANKQGTSWPIVIDDMRWPNEYQAVADLPNGLLIKIIRPGETAYSAHGSEGLLEDKTFDYTIINNSTLEELCSMVQDVLILGKSNGARALGQKEVIIEP